MNKDNEILNLILKKESDFFKEIRALSQYLQTDDLSDYLYGLNDLKNNFLKPLEQQLSDNTNTVSTNFSDRYWFLEKT